MKFKFITDDLEQKPIRVFVELDEDGDIIIKATDGETVADIAYLISKGEHAGKLCICGVNESELNKLGFVTDADGEIATY